MTTKLLILPAGVLLLAATIGAVLLAKNGRDHKALWRDLHEFHRSIRKLFVASQRITPGT